MYLCIHVYVCNSLTGQEVQGHPLTHQTVASGSPQLMDSCTFQDPIPSRGGWSDDEGGVADYGGEMSPLLTAPHKVRMYICTVPAVTGQHSRAQGMYTVCLLMYMVWLYVSV